MSLKLEAKIIKLEKIDPFKCWKNEWNTRFPRIESGVLKGKPRNYLELQQSFRDLAQSSPDREVGAIYLTDQKGTIVPIYALCGGRHSVAMQFPDADMLKEFMDDQSVNTYVKFHSHPEQNIKVDFSPTDRSRFERLQNKAEIEFKNFAYDLLISDRELYFSNAVGSLTDQYKWEGFWVSLQSSGLIPTRIKKE